ncbi:PfkB family carbohydrate kinase [Thioclava sp.]|uniref:PfkB family carbohydrate kinase n=1 Tax=Thioclava sp. TaxID=1933450 RepID=UPI003AA92779
MTAIDTTGAGDTYAGYLVAALAEGLAVKEAMRLAVAAIKITRPGSADVIPVRAEVDDFLAGSAQRIARAAHRAHRIYAAMRHQCLA